MLPQDQDVMEIDESLQETVQYSDILGGQTCSISAIS